MSADEQAEPASMTDVARTRDGDAGARIAEGLREGIIAGQYPPGARIRQEDLAAQYGASRVPVREAIRQLEYEGLVTVVGSLESGMEIRGSEGESILANHIFGG